MAYGNYFGWKPYVPVAARRRQAAQRLAQLRKKGGEASPVVIDGRKIARTFWGEAWCENLERYSDFANRLPRGRTYVRNGSVVDLRIAPGAVTALVSGSDIYEVEMKVAAVPPTRWRAICKDCAGAIDSVVELLQGKLSQGVMARMCQVETGLFPSPQEITFSCSCPDWASMCKHIAAVLYGIGARLDHQPELLFTLRKVDQQDLIAKAGSDISKTRKGPASAKVLESDDLSGMFGIEMAPTTPSKRTAASQITTKASTGVKSERKPAPKRSARKLLLTSAKRRAVSERMKKYWAARRASMKKPKASESS